MARLFRLYVLLHCACFCSAVYAQQPGAGLSAQGRRPPVVQGQPVAAAKDQFASQPDWFPLAPEHDKYLNDILKYWEYTASKVERYRCKFMRWEYDSSVLREHPDIAATIAQGNIQYAAPDKGLFQVEKMWYVDVEKEGGAPIIVKGKTQYVARTDVPGEYWICDGKSIFEVDGRNKQIIQRELPREMQGQHIADGPLPFLFGAKAEVMKQQYWIRALPAPKKGKFYLEAIPRQRAQAADFKAVHVVIDEQDFLPEALLLFKRNGDHDTYEFQEREQNWNLLPEKLNPFHQQFFAPKVPNGWKLVLEPFQAAPPAAGPARTATPTQPMGPRQAARPAAKPGQR